MIKVKNYELLKVPKFTIPLEPPILVNKPTLISIENAPYFIRGANFFVGQTTSGQK